MSYFNSLSDINVPLAQAIKLTEEIAQKVNFNLTASPWVNPSDFNAFSNYNAKISNHLAVLKNICAEDNQMFIKTATKSLSDANRLTKELQKVFTEVDAVIVQVSNLLYLSKSVPSMKHYEENLNKGLEMAREYSDEIEVFRFAIDDIEDLIKTDKSAFDKDKDLIKHYRTVSNEIIEELKKGRIEKNDYNRVVMQHLDKITSCLDIVKEEFALNETFSGVPSFLPKQEVIEKIVSKIHSHRDVSVVEFSAHNGELLVPFMNKDNDKKFDFVPYFIGNVEDSANAKSLGIKNIAKGGIDRIEHNTFDVTLCFASNFFFLAEGRVKMKNPNPSHYYIGSDLTMDLEGNIAFFNRMINSNIPRNDGYIFINIPRFAVNYFRPFLLKSFTILGAYSLNDEFDQVLFVLQYIKTENQFSKLFLEVMTKKNPSIDDLQDLHISKNSLIKLPEPFRSNVYDKEDLRAMLKKSKVSTIETLKNHFSPEDEIKSLSNPLQEPKPGHLAAIASTRMVNGIYENHDENTVCIFSTKLVRQEGMDISYLPDGTRVEKNIKRNSIVATATFPDGKLITLLNTDSISEDAKAEIEDDEEASS